MASFGYSFVANHFSFARRSKYAFDFVKNSRCCFGRNFGVRSHICKCDSSRAESFPAYSAGRKVVKRDPSRVAVRYDSWGIKLRNSQMANW
jgi:hypothetical protein